MDRSQYIPYTYFICTGNVKVHVENKSKLLLLKCFDTKGCLNFLIAFTAVSWWMDLVSRMSCHWAVTRPTKTWPRTAMTWLFVRALIQWMQATCHRLSTGLQNWESNIVDLQSVLLSQPYRTHAGRTAERALRRQVVKVGPYHAPGPTSYHKTNHQECVWAIVAAYKVWSTLNVLRFNDHFGRIPSQ